MEKLRQLLTEGADVNEKGGLDKSTPLHQAVSRGLHAPIDRGDPGIFSDKEMVRVLLEHGADVSAENSHGDTPLHSAAYNIHDWFQHDWDQRDGNPHKLEIVRLLIQYGGKPSVQNKCGETPLHIAVMNMQGHFEVVRLLLDAGADALLKKNNGEVPIIIAMLELMKFMLSMDVGEEDSFLNIDIRKNVLRVVELLLNHGADVSATSEYESSTSLHMAAVCCDEPLARLLLQNGADVSSKDKAGRTPLHEAVLSPLLLFR
jgi:ankyrin repeat protein